ILRMSTKGHVAHHLPMGSKQNHSHYHHKPSPLCTFSLRFLLGFPFTGSGVLRPFRLSFVQKKKGSVWFGLVWSCELNGYFLVCTGGGWKSTLLSEFLSVFHFSLLLLRSWDHIRVRS